MGLKAPAAQFSVILIHGLHANPDATWFDDNWNNHSGSVQLKNGPLNLSITKRTTGDFKESELIFN